MGLLLGFVILWSLRGPSSDPNGTQGAEEPNGGLTGLSQGAPSPATDANLRSSQQAGPGERVSEGSSAESRQGASLVAHDAPPAAAQEEGLWLSIRALDGEGEPWATSQVMLQFEPYTTPILGGETGTPSPEPPSSSPTVVTVDHEGEGHFRGRWLNATHPPQGWALTVMGPDRIARAWIEPVHLPEQGSHDFGTVTLLTPRERFPNRLVQGTVLSDAGEPIPSVMGVIAPTHSGTWGPREEGQVIVHADGRFEAYGPPSPDGVQITFLAPNYQDETYGPLDTPHTGLEAVLAKYVLWKGTLLVPEHGPPITEYGVWVTQAGRGIGTSPQKDGSLRAFGSSQALAIQITHPGFGTKLLEQELVVRPTEEEGLGVIDLRGLVWVLDVVLVDESGQPWKNQNLQVNGEASLVSFGQFTTDGEGRLLTVFPTTQEVITLGRDGHEVVTLTAQDRRSRVRLP